MMWWQYNMNHLMTKKRPTSIRFRSKVVLSDDGDKSGWAGLKICLFWVLLILPVGEVLAQWHSRTAALMGTQIKVELWHEDRGKAEALIDAVLAEIDRVEQAMSPYIESSEVYRINQLAASARVPVSHELSDLIDQALQYSKRSNGAFDITFASVGFLYDYRQGISPDASTLAEKLEAISYKHIVLNREKHWIRFTDDRVKIDLGGIAKGYAVDRAVELLQRASIKHALVRAGGDTRLIGDRKGRPWWLGIKNPRGEGHVSVMPLENVAVSTSGDYERFFISADGTRHHHILNPHTGRSASEVSSVTVIGNTATQTDALSTSVFVLGVEPGLSYINGIPDVSVIIIDRQGRLFYSDDLVQPAPI